VATLPANNSFEGGSDETTITTGNSGGASGTAFEVVTIGAGNALVFDTARAAHGSLSARIDLGNNPATACLYGWTWTETTSAWGWIYLYISSIFASPSTMRLIGFEQTGVGVGRILLQNDRAIQVTDKNFAHSASSTGLVPLDTWMRISWRILCSATVGEIEARIYTGDSTTPISGGTVQTTANADTGTGVNRGTYGCNAGWTGAPFTFWTDDANINSSGDFGPSVIPLKSTNWLSAVGW
jgi:hypothetical protein